MNNQRPRGPKIITILFVLVCAYILFFYSQNLDIVTMLINFAIFSSVCALLFKNYCKKRSFFKKIFLFLFVNLNFLLTIPLLNDTIWLDHSGSLFDLYSISFYCLMGLTWSYTIYELWRRNDVDLLCRIYIFNPIVLFLGLVFSNGFLYGNLIASTVFILYNFLFAIVLFKQALDAANRIRFNFSLLVAGVTFIVAIIMRFCQEMKSIDGLIHSLIGMIFIILILNIFFKTRSYKRR